MLTPLTGFIATVHLILGGLSDTFSLPARRSLFYADNTLPYCCNINLLISIGSLHQLHLQRNQTPQCKQSQAGLGPRSLIPRYLPYP